MMIRVSVTDDHELFRSGIAMLLNKTNACEVVAQNGSAEELLEDLKSIEVDVALIDISMGKMSGLEAVAMCKKQFPQVRCIVLTMHDEGQYILKAIRNGAYGYLLKDCDANELKEAVEQVYLGKKYFNRNISDLMIQSVTVEEDIKQLSKRETEVLHLVAQGKTAKEIANDLIVSVRTIETHRSNILKKLDVQNTAELITKASSLGIL